MVNADSAGQQDVQSNGQRKDKSPLFSPRFRSAAAMAGWDEETLAALIVEDTPDRERSKQKKRSDNASDLKTPPTNSRRKRRAHRRSPNSLPVAILDLEDAAQPALVEPPKETEPEVKKNTPELKKESCEKETADVSTTNSAAIPCMDRLREELSCAICLEICFEPSTTPCGHSFCKKCLRSAADKCGKKCPKCRQLMSNGRSCTINTILWNTIQLLFPQEVEARKAAASASKDKQVQRKTTPVKSRNEQEIGSGGGGAETGRLQELRRLRRNSIRPSRGSRPPSQDEDAALALRLQREEYMMHRNPRGLEYSSSLIVARANLRAMASRASRRG